MEVIISRFLHIAEQIFEQLDDKSLKNCREVAKSWHRSIDHRNYSWIRILNFPKILKDGNTYLHIAAKNGQSKMFEFIIQGSQLKNPTKQHYITPLHLGCENGHFKIVEMIFSNYSKEVLFEFN